MLKDIYLLHLKSFLRSSTFQGDLVKKLLVGLAISNLLVLLCIPAYFLPEILDGIFSKNISLEVKFGQLFIYYLLIDLVLRYFFQSIPGVNYPHFALLPIDKQRLISSMLLISNVNLFNLAGLIFIFPFWIRYLLVELGFITSMIWLSGVLFSIIGIHFLSVLIKLQLNTFRAGSIILSIAIGLIFVFVYFDGFSLRDLSSLLFGTNLTNGFSPPFFIILVITLFYLTKTALLKGIYEDDKLVNSAERKENHFFRKVTADNIVGSLFINEILLILRNKRTIKMIFVTAVISIAYFYLIYNIGQYDLDDNLILLFFGFFIIGFWLISYGQFLTAWESTFYDGLMVLPIAIEDYLKAKWIVLVVPVTMVYLIVLILSLFLITEFTIFLTALWFLIIGPTSLITIAIGIFNKKRVVINQVSWFENQGNSGIQSLILPLVFILFLFSVVPFYLIGHFMIGLMFWIVFGIGIIATHSFWLRKLAALFVNRKYTKLENYRKKSD